MEEIGEFIFNQDYYVNLNQKIIKMTRGEIGRADTLEGKNRMLHIKLFNDLNKKDPRSESKICYICGEEVSSFRNSHSIPAFCLRNIAQNGMIRNYNTITKIELKKEKTGVNASGTFHIICEKCENVSFKAYEIPSAYENPPTQQMMAQIHMKNSLFFIDKKENVIHFYLKLIKEYEDGRLKKNYEFDFRTTEEDRCTLIQSDLDRVRAHIYLVVLKKIREKEHYDECFRSAVKFENKSGFSNYYLAWFCNLPYTVPLAYQGSIALYRDLENNLINRLEPGSLIHDIQLCIFPQKEFSTVFMFTEQRNTKYRRFFKQFNKLNLDEQLNVVNHIVFTYTEDFFLSSSITDDVIDDLRKVANNQTEMFHSPEEGPYKCLDTQLNWNPLVCPNILVEEYAINCHK